MMMKLLMEIEQRYQLRCTIANNEDVALKSRICINDETVHPSMVHGPQHGHGMEHGCDIITLNGD